MLIEAVEHFERILTNVLTRNSMLSPRDNVGFGINYFFGEKSMKKLFKNNDLPLLGNL